MTEVRTDLRGTQPSARGLSYQPRQLIPATNVQDAIDAVVNTFRYVNSTRVFTDIGGTGISAGDQTVVIKKTAPAITDVFLPDLATWGGTDVTVKDGSNNAGTYPINIVPYGSAQTIDGYNASQLNGGHFQIGGDGGSLNLRPLPDKTGWLTGVGGGGTGAVSVSAGGGSTPGSGVSSIAGRSGAITLSSGPLASNVLAVQELDVSLSDVTTNDSSVLKHGFLPKLAGGTTMFLRADGVWATPPSTGGGGTAGISSLGARTGDITLASGPLPSNVLALKEIDLSLSDVTNANSTTGQHGFLRKLSGVASQFLDGSGNWSVPPASGGGITSLTTTGTSGPATLSGSNLNVPIYSGGGSAKHYIDVIDYGADPTGASDSDAAFNSAWAALSSRGGVIYAPPGRYRFNAKFQKTLPDARFSVSIIGSGAGVTEFYWPNADGGMSFTYTASGLGNTLAYNNMTFSGASFVTGQANGGYGIELKYVNSNYGFQYFSEQTIFRDLEFHGSDWGFTSTKYWSQCNRVIGINIVRWLNCQFFGAQPSGTSCLGQGVYIAGNPNYYGVIYDFTSCIWNQCDYAFLYGPWIQGVTISQCNMNAGNGAGTAAVKILPDQGSLLAQLYISDTQMDNGMFGVQGDSTMFNLNCVNTCFTTSRANGIGCTCPVYMSSISNCTFQNSGNLANCTGLYVSGYGASVNGFNTYKDLSVAYNWASGTAQCKSSHSIFINVTTVYINSGSSGTPGGQSF